MNKDLCNKMDDGLITYGELRGFLYKRRDVELFDRLNTVIKDVNAKYYQNEE